MPNITVYAGISQDPNDMREASTVNHGTCALSLVNERLWSIGNEYKTADYFTSRQVVIVIDPDPQVGELSAELQQKIADLSRDLESHGTNIRGIAAQLNAARRNA